LELREKAESGSLVAQSMLGICYLYGIDTAINYLQAFRLLRAASDRGSSRAVVNLARMYAEGCGVPQDSSEAIRLYAAVAKVEFFAALELGRIYSVGVGVSPNLEAATKWYSLAAGWRDRISETEISEQVAWATGVPRAEDIRRAEFFVGQANRGATG